MYVPLDISGVLSLFEKCGVSLEPLQLRHPGSGLKSKPKPNQTKLKPKIQLKPVTYWVSKSMYLSWEIQWKPKIIHLNQYKT